MQVPNCLHIIKFWGVILAVLFAGPMPSLSSNQQVSNHWRKVQCMN